ncbi:MAG: archaellin/type IV pilin N-terminal domain-containing protein [Nitrosarchaeum sp.]
MKKKSKLSKRRGVTDIISTMLLMAITVTGATTLTYFVNDSFVSGNLATASSLETATKSVQLMGYDTRDSVTLLQISTLDNKFGDGKLCGVSCTGVGLSDRLPINGGSEFIVIKIKNNSINSIFLENIQLNNVIHAWDIQTSGATLNTVQDLSSGGNYPHDGSFSILPISSNIQFTSNEIQSGKTVNLLIKLGTNDQDILLNKGIRVFLNIGNMHPVDFLIESGNAR